MNATTYVLWGSHPNYVDGTPIKLTAGSLRACNSAQRSREQEGGWKLATYLQGTAPIGLRMVAAAA